MDSTRERGIAETLGELQERVQGYLQWGLADGVHRQARQLPPTHRLHPPTMQLLRPMTGQSPLQHPQVHWIFGGRGE
jgi:hypothetical protein